ncbi:MAG: efflux RND transporter periplasmic adaptor subunit [Spirochaetes bacterium]|nr:MAG: efflux RND transporter periplasmic adaptor subunit [Spirochaetota bacterium]
MTKKTATAILIFTILLIPFGCSKQKSAKKETASTDTVETTVFAVSTITAVKGDIKEYLELNGDITARTEVNVYPETTGKLKSFSVKIGQRVKKDQVIAQIDPSRPGMTFAFSPVKAPITGTVTAIPAQVGSVAAPSIPIAKIGKMNELEIIVYVAERFISKMKIGLPARITTEAYPEKTFKGAIREISPVVDPASRTLEIKLHVEDPGRLLKAGMFASVKLITEEKSSIVKIPAETLLSRFGQTYVFVVPPADASGEKRVEKRIIVPGLRIDNQVEITEGLEAGEEIVIHGQTLLADGVPVKVVSSEAPLESSANLQ